MESRGEKRLRCWESVFPKGVIEAPCPVCQCSLIRYVSTSGNTFQQLHVVPASKQGSDQSWNLVPGCGCNQNMRHMNLVDWMGTRGNKRQLLKALLLAKYKSLVAPCFRTLHDREQLIKWVYRTYHPQCLEEYRDWLMLLESDLAAIQCDLSSDPGNSDIVKKEEVKLELVESMMAVVIPPRPPDVVSMKTESLCAMVIEVPVKRDDNGNQFESGESNSDDKTKLGAGIRSGYFERTYRYNVRQRLGHTNIHMPYPSIDRSIEK